MKKVMSYAKKALRSFIKIGGIWWFVYMVYCLLDMYVRILNGAYTHYSAVEWAMVIWLVGISGTITVWTISDLATSIMLWIKSKKSEVAT